MQAIFSNKILRQESCMQKMEKMLEAQFQFTTRKILQKETKRNATPPSSRRHHHIPSLLKAVIARKTKFFVAIYCVTLWIASQVIKAGKIAMTKRHASSHTVIARKTKFFVAIYYDTATQGSAS